MKKQNIDWENLKFEVVPTRSMWQAESQAGNAWANGGLVPYGKVKMSPASCVMNYGQGVFEGLKAYHTAKDRIVLFRPQMNAKRIGESTRRLCIPEITEDYFLDAVRQTVNDNIDFVPPYKKGSMYIRPISFGTSPSISVGPSSDYLFMVFVSPVGPYFKGGVKPLHLIVSEQYHRAAPKGIGNVKAIGNYSASLLPGSKAKAAGFNEVIYMKASDETCVEEMGSANLFALTGKILKTPRLCGSILPGITRDSVICIAKELMGLEVIEGDLSLNELINADEVFCTGTAVVVTPIGFVTKGGAKHTIGSGEFGAIALELRKTLLGIQREEIDDTFDWIYPITN